MGVWGGREVWGGRGWKEAGRGRRTEGVTLHAAICNGTDRAPWGSNTGTQPPYEELRCLHPSHQMLAQGLSA